MKKLKYITGILFFLALTVANVQALPTISGTTGLVKMPTADGLKFKEFNVGLDYLSSATSTGNGQILYKANLGTLEGFELGFIGQSQQEGVFINLKYYLTSGLEEDPLLMAIGLNNLSSFNQTEFYMVASKLFGGGFSMHVGFMADLQGQNADTSLMLGTEYYFNETMSVAIDTIGNQQVYAPNIGLRFRTSPNLIFTIQGTDLFRKINGTDASQTVIGLVWTDFI